MRKKICSWMGIGWMCWLCASVALSCSEESDCTGANRPMLNVNFYTIMKDTLESGTVRDSLVAIAIDTLTVTAFGTDSVIINKDVAASSVSLPLRYAEETTVLVLQYTDELKDTVTLTHHNTPYFLNMDCGYQMKQELADVTYTTHGIDSIATITPNIGIYGTENLRIFY